MIQSQEAASTYELAKFGFGKVYFTNNTVTSQYISNFTLGAANSFEMSIAQQGMGLPSAVYSQFKSDLDFSKFECNQTMCVLSQSCSEIESSLNDFVF